MKQFTESEKRKWQEDKRWIESELRSYDNTKREWEQIQDDIIYGGGCGEEGMPRGTDIGNTTQSKALRLISNRRLAQLERTIKAFERVLTRLPEDRFKMIVLRYWTHPQPLTDDGIAMELFVDKRTVYNWCNVIIKELAKELGMVD